MPTKSPLPIDACLNPILRAVGEAGGAVVQAPPGAGKTTRVPPALLDQLGGQVVVVQPRRVAARAAARRVAQERSTSLGDEVGYHVRFDRKAGKRTGLMFVTEGIALTMLQRDPFLEGVTALVFDEVHERRLGTDLAAAMALRVRRDARQDLAIVCMSATLDAAPWGAWLDAPVIASEGRAYPVDVAYLPYPTQADVETLVAEGVRQELPETGHVLAFLPGVREIRRTADRLTGLGRPVLPLHARLPPAEQDAALAPSTRPKVVLATNVAETSVTLEGVAVVVDGGLARVPHFDPRTALDTLRTERISASSADQRAGRAGRTGPGRCLRLWTEREHRGLAAQIVPEVARLDLAGPVLQLLAWGERDPLDLPWLEAPTPRRLESAARLLRELCAIDTQGITETGRRMAQLPLHPRLAALAIDCAARGHPAPGALLAAALSEGLPRLERRRPTTDSDLCDALDGLDERAHRWTRRAARELQRRLPNGPVAGAPPRDEAIRRAALAAWPDRVALRRHADEPRARMVGGRGVVLTHSAVRDARLFVCVDTDDGGGGGEARVRVASAIDEAWLDLDDEVAVSFDPATEKVMAERRRCYRDLVLHAHPTRAPEEDAIRAVARAAASDPGRALGLDRPSTAALLARLRFIAWARPALGWPSTDPEALAEVAEGEARLRRVRRFADLARAAADILRSRLDHRQLQALSRDAPVTLQLPKGRPAKLEYRGAAAPVLAVRMQRLFGVQQTPKVAGVPVLLHLLAPNGRPQQITDDLAGFWKRTWPQVRKELRGRYPKHAWPADPNHTDQ